MRFFLTDKISLFEFFCKKSKLYKKKTKADILYF